jgi:hypothetical protein
MMHEIHLWEAARHLLTLVHENVDLEEDGPNIVCRSKFECDEMSKQKRLCIFLQQSTERYLDMFGRFGIYNYPMNFIANPFDFKQIWFCLPKYYGLRFRLNEKRFQIRVGRQEHQSSNEKVSSLVGQYDFQEALRFKRTRGHIQQEVGPLEPLIK